MDHNKILGVVLAGGKSQRFGEDKSQVKLGNKILIDHILDQIYNQFEEIYFLLSTHEKCLEKYLAEILCCCNQRFHKER